MNKRLRDVTNVNITSMLCACVIAYPPFIRVHAHAYTHGRVSIACINVG